MTCTTPGKHDQRCVPAWLMITDMFTLLKDRIAVYCFMHALFIIHFYYSILYMVIIDAITGMYQYFSCVVVNITTFALIHMCSFLLTISFQAWKKINLDWPLDSYTSRNWINHVWRHACALIPGVYAVVFLVVCCSFMQNFRNNLKDLDLEVVAVKCWIYFCSLMLEGGS